MPMAHIARHARVSTRCPEKVPRRNLAISRGQTISVKRGILVAPREWARTIDRMGNNRRIAARHSVPFKNQYTFAGLQPRIAFQVVVMRNGKVTRVLRECNRAGNRGARPYIASVL